LIGISDNNEAINEFNKLIKPDLLKISGKSLITVSRYCQIISLIRITGEFMVTMAVSGMVFKQESADYWSYENITLVFEKMQKVKILHSFYCRADKIRQF
jgi:hypothetical protein